MIERTIYEIKALYRDDFRVRGYEFGSGEKSVCIVGSMRGNEVQQLYVCSQLVKKFKQLEEEGITTYCYTGSYEIPVKIHPKVTTKLTVQVIEG